MPRSKFLILDKCKVFTLDSTAKIKYEQYPLILKDLKSHSLLKKNIKNITRLSTALEKLNWSLRVNTVIYNGPTWGLRGIVTLNILAKYIGQNQYIHLFNSYNDMAWSYRFINQKPHRTSLKEVYLDNLEDQQMLDLIQTCTTHLLDLGYSRKELVNFIDKIYIRKLLG